MNPKLSKLQRFILASGFQASRLPSELGALGRELESGHVVSRNQILVSFFGLSFCRVRRHGRLVEDEEINRIDWRRADPLVFNRANATFYRSIRRLEARGLVEALGKGRWRLTAQGVEEVNKRSHVSEKKPNM